VRVTARCTSCLPSACAASSARSPSACSRSCSRTCCRRAARRADQTCVFPLIRWAHAKDSRTLKPAWTDRSAPIRVRPRALHDPLVGLAIRLLARTTIQTCVRMSRRYVPAGAYVRWPMDVRTFTHIHARSHIHIYARTFTTNARSRTHSHIFDARLTVTMGGCVGFGEVGIWLPLAPVARVKNQSSPC
jgi:hypothetical protein